MITDLAAPVFAMALGAAAVVVGGRIDGGRDLRRPVWRWTQILLVGLAIDVVTDGSIEARGVLPTLAILGLVITVTTAAGVRSRGRGRPRLRSASSPRCPPRRWSAMRPCSCC